MRQTLWFARSLALAAIFLPALTSAQSVVWGTNVPDLAYLNQSSGECVPRILSSYASVQYSAQAYDGNGASICGGTIAKGTRVTFKPAPYASSHIYWFGTGYYADSPYGDWIPNAGAPATSGICLAKNYYSSVVDRSTGQLEDHYGTLSVHPPTNSVTGFGSVFRCGSPASDGSVSCTASTEGSANVTFGFAATNGHFYALGPQPHNQCTPNVPDLQYPAGAWYNAGGGRGWYICPGAAESGPYTLTVPAQEISCPITVVNPNGNAPANPGVSGTHVSGGDSCIVGIPYTIQFSSTDPDHDQVKYGVDWDNNGTIDQFVPSSGYVNSGVTQQASRTFATAGPKTIKVITQDSRGLTSGWVTFHTTCADQADNSDENDNSDSNSGSNNGSGGSTSPEVSIRAPPSLVRAGDTTTVSWSASNVVGSTCAVTSPTDAAAHGTGDWTGALSSGVTTSPIQSQTVYTLSCTGLDDAILTQSTTVNIVPSFQEL